MIWRNSSLKHRITRAIGIADHGERVRDLGRLISEGIIEGFKTKESDNMTKQIHVLVDESLGGIKRGYVEVDRKADVGDYIDTELGVHSVSKRRTIDVIAGDISGYYSRIFTHDEYSVLEPTDIVHIENGVSPSKYRLVDRKAEVGERVIIVDVRDSNADGYKEGDIFTVMLPGYDVILTDDDITLLDNEYRVLEPVETSPQSTDEIIANLVRRVAELERINEMQAKENRLVHDNIEGAKRDIETWAQDVENVWKKVEENDIRLEYVEKDMKKLGDKVEMVIDDIASLDERTQPKQITIDADVLARLLGGAARD